MSKLLSLLQNNARNTSPIRIKLLGDSITQGVGGTGFCQDGERIIDAFARNRNGYCWANLFKDYVEQKYNCIVTNNACSGTKIEYIIENYDKLVDKNDDFLICMIGTNNRHQDKNTGERRDTKEFAREFYDNVLTLNDKIRKDGKTVLFLSSIPASVCNEERCDTLWRILHMNDINAIYKAAQEKTGFLFVSLYDLFTDYLSKGNLPLDACLSDGLHPNDKGYRIMFDLLRENLQL